MAKQKRKSKTLCIILIFAAVMFIITSWALNETGVWDDFANSENLFSTKTTAKYYGSTDFTAYFLDVGQGDSALFVSRGCSMLIDSGEKESSGTVLSYLNGYGVKSLQYVVATHAHSDHMGGMADIISAVPTENIIISEPCDDSASTATYESFLDAAEKSGAEITLAEPGLTFSLGDAECTVLAPFEVSSEENNNSVVMLITAGETSILMTGDAEKSVENQILKYYPDLNADIIKIGHHGSNTSSGNAFINAISPETAIISVGKGNIYGHPSEKTLAMLENYNIKYYQTDVSGTITVSVSDKSYSITAQR